MRSCRPKNKSLTGGTPWRCSCSMKVFCARIYAHAQVDGWHVESLALESLPDCRHACTQEQELPPTSAPQPDPVWKAIKCVAASLPPRCP